LENEKHLKYHVLSYLIWFMWLIKISKVGRNFHIVIYRTCCANDNKRRQQGKESKSTSINIEVRVNYWCILWEMVGPVRPQFVLFGSSIVELSYSCEGWGATLANLYARKVFDMLHLVLLHASWFQIFVLMLRFLFLFGFGACTLICAILVFLI